MAVTPAAAQLPVTARAESAGAASPSWRQSLRAAALAYGLLRVAALLLGLVGGRVDLGAAATDPIRLFLPFLRLDAVWQVDIAADGYQPYTAVHLAGHVYDGSAFLPGLPGLIHAVSAATGVSAFAAGLIVCAAAGFGGLLLLHRLALEEHGPRVAWLAVAAMALLPASVYLTSVFTESLLLLEFTAAFLCVRRGRTVPAAVLVAAATVTKLYSVILVVPLAIEVAERHRGDLRAQGRRLALLAAGPVIGVVGLAAYYRAEFGQPLRFLSSQASWDHAFSAPWVGFQRSLETIWSGGVDAAMAVVQLAVIALLAWATAYAWRHLRRSYAALLGLSLAVFVTNGLLVSVARYSLAVFPLAIVLAHWASAREVRLRRALIAGVPLCFAVTWLFVSGRFTG